MQKKEKKIDSSENETCENVLRPNPKSKKYF